MRLGQRYFRQVAGLGYRLRSAWSRVHVHSRLVSYPWVFLLAATQQRSFLSIRLLEAIDVDFLHLHHCLHDIFRLCRILVVKIIEKNRGADLPGDAKFVRQPAASDFFAAGRKFVPKRVHFLLTLAIDEQGHRQRKLVLRAAVERDESLSLKLERNCQNAAFRSREGERQSSLSDTKPDIRISMCERNKNPRDLHEQHFTARIGRYANCSACLHFYEQAVEKLDCEVPEHNETANMAVQQACYERKHGT